MKSLIILAALSISTLAAADCNVTLLVKKDGAKSAKLDGVSFSAKQIAALKTICNVSVKPMSVEEQIADFKASLEKRMAKAASKAALE